jgi:hypothetical protein
VSSKTRVRLVYFLLDFADFSSVFVSVPAGGGVLTRGCVQEEIRLTICPESLVGLLFVEVMDEHESVTIIGCERFVDYTGYSRTFQFEKHHLDPTPIDPLRNRMKTVLVAIDAISYRPRAAQFKREMILRELLKAYSGFSLEDSVLGHGADQVALEAQAVAKGAITSYILPSEGGAVKAGVTDVKYDFLQIGTGNWVSVGKSSAKLVLRVLVQQLCADPVPFCSIAVSLF